MYSFKYLSFDDVRDAGISEQEISDCALLELIEQAGAIVNSLTENWFIPVREVMTLDGTGSRIILLPSPVIEIIDEEPEIVYENNTHTTMVPKVGTYEPFFSFGSPEEMIKPIAKYVGKGKLVSQAGSWHLRSMIRFPDGLSNILVEGYFGHVDKPIKKYETTTALDFENTDTTITLTDGTGFSKGKIILVEVDDEIVFYDTIKSITGNVVTIDAAELDATIVSGATVKTFGKVPFGVKRAALIALNELKSSIADSISVASAGRVISEQTDNYEYKLQSGDSITSGGGGSYLTSMAQLLIPFIRPPFVGFA